MPEPDRGRWGASDKSAIELVQLGGLEPPTS
jgi:hypothetical protein